MLNRIKINKIIFDHFGTLKRLDKQNKFMSKGDFVLFIFFPIVLSIFSYYFNMSLKENVGNLISAISIFGGFLLNLLAIVYSQIDNLKKDANKSTDQLKKTFVKEIHINISFCILLSVIIVLILFTLTNDFKRIVYGSILELLISSFTVFLISLFSLTLLMVLYRIYILLKKDIEND